MARKTADVQDVKDTANRLLLHSSDDRDDFRRGVIALVETVLVSTGNYRGFNYLPSQISSPGVLCDDFDETRRFYY